MIFVTVGTHEQPFNRLIKKVDELVAEGTINEPVVMQIGFSTYIPKHCEWHKMLSYDEMKQYIDEARIVITHGGPASFIEVLQAGKIPVVVPRLAEFSEHVNDHQEEFAQVVNKRYGNIIVIEDVSELGRTLLDYETITRDMDSSTLNHNEMFNDKLGKIVDSLF